MAHLLLCELHPCVFLGQLPLLSPPLIQNNGAMLPGVFVPALGMPECSEEGFVRSRLVRIVLDLLLMHHFVLETENLLAVGENSGEAG